MQEKNKETNESEIPEMNLNYNIDKNKKPVVTQNNELAKKELENKKKEIEKFKGFVLKKFKFIRAIGILPPQSHKDFIE